MNIIACLWYIILYISASTGQLTVESTVQMDQHAHLLRCELVRLPLIFQLMHQQISLTFPRAVKMSILALYYRIGSGKRGLPWIVQGKAVLATAGIMTAFSLAVFLVRYSVDHILPTSY